MRLIDADALIEDIRKHSESYFADDFAHEWVDKQPAIIPERKTGHWIVVSGMNEQCSKCGKFFPLSDFKDRPFEINYCPSCGARMEREG